MTSSHTPRLINTPNSLIAFQASIPLDFWKEKIVVGQNRL